MTIDEVINYATTANTYNNITTNQKGNGFVFEQSGKEIIYKQLGIIENLTTILNTAHKEIKALKIK